MQEVWRRPPHPTPHARGPPRSEPGSATSSDAQRAPSRCTSSGPDFPHSATSPSRQQSPASAAAEGCPHTAYSHRRAGHGLEDLRGNEVCSVTLRSRTSTFRLNVVLKIEPSLRIRTPIRALSDAARAKFDGVRLADERFHRPASISLVLGSDVYANLIQPGFLKIDDGLPVAQNTVFGWTVSGTCTK
nr:uncharacterized protein LOC120284356 isoform X1 [Drosophila simulans]XP_039147449.1 uncharacterized protein LOC120284356 isoform X2 [Drosophila simulans]